MAALAAAAGCSGISGGQAAFTRPAPGPGRVHDVDRTTRPGRVHDVDRTTRPDLSGAGDYARSGSEFRIGWRLLYVMPPGEDADFLDQGTGEGFVVVYRAEDAGRLEGDIYFEVVLERSSHEETGTGRAAEYWRACAGFRWADLWSSRVEPFFSVGGAYNQLGVSGGEALAGFGIYGGVGVEFLLARAASATVDARLHKFWASSSGDAGGGIALVVAVALGARF